MTPQTNATDYDDLIRRLEQATGPDRELDAAIYEIVVGLRMYESIYERCGDLCLRYFPDPTGPSYGRLPHYTSSLDAALTLVPEGWYVDLIERQSSGAPMSSFGQPGRFMCRVGQWGNSNTDRHGLHDDRALALCIAGLHARAAIAKGAA